MLCQGTARGEWGEPSIGSPDNKRPGHMGQRRAVTPLDGLLVTLSKRAPQ